MKEWAMDPAWILRQTLAERTGEASAGAYEPEQSIRIQEEQQYG